MNFLTRSFACRAFPGTSACPRLAGEHYARLEHYWCYYAKEQDGCYTRDAANHSSFLGERMRLLWLRVQ
jgi:hypothetical protein